MVQSDVPTAYAFENCPRSAGLVNGNGSPTPVGVGYLGVGTGNL